MASLSVPRLNFVGEGRTNGEVFEAASGRLSFMRFCTASYRL